MTPIFTTGSFIYEFPPAGLRHHTIDGIPHTYCYERLAGFFCMTFGHPVLSAQIKRDSISFSTKAVPAVARECAVS